MAKLTVAWLPRPHQLKIFGHTVGPVCVVLGIDISATNRRPHPREVQAPCFAENALVLISIKRIEFRLRCTNRNKLGIT